MDQQLSIPFTAETAVTTALSYRLKVHKYDFWDWIRDAFSKGQYKVDNVLIPKTRVVAARTKLDLAKFKYEYVKDTYDGLNEVYNISW